MVLHVGHGRGSPADETAACQGWLSWNGRLALQGCGGAGQSDLPSQERQGWECRGLQRVPLQEWPHLLARAMGPCQAPLEPYYSARSLQGKHMQRSAGHHCSCSCREADLRCQPATSAATSSPAGLQMDMPVRMG